MPETKVGSKEVGMKCPCSLESEAKQRGSPNRRPFFPGPANSTACVGLGPNKPLGSYVKDSCTSHLSNSIFSMTEAAGGNKGAPFLGHKGSGSEGMWGTQPCRKQENPDYVNTQIFQAELQTK